MSSANPLLHFVEAIDLKEAIRATVLIFAGVLLSQLYFRLVRRGLFRRMPRFGQRLGGWLILALFIGAALHQLGFKLSFLMGAAGIFTVAIGFAAQTSAANVISGLFVIGEGSFGVGDIIQVGSHTGEVLSIDVLSVKLRTFDNRYVRIPNETIIKTDVVNLSKFPIRRIDLQLSITYNSDIARARAVLQEVAANNPFCLEEPRPLIVLQGFGESSVDIQFSVWVARENFMKVRDGVQEQIKLAFDAAHIEFPFPTRTLYMVGDGESAAKNNAA